MSVINMSSTRPMPETEIADVAQLAVTLSARLTRVHAEDLSQVVSEALRQVAAATRIEDCQLVEFTETGAVAREHFIHRVAIDDDRALIGAQELPALLGGLPGRIR